MGDPELLDLLRRDPEEGMKALIARYGALVYAAAKSRLPQGTFCPADVEGCAADAFSEFYLDLDKYDPARGSIRAWLCTIARHNALDLARRRAPLPLDEELAGTASEALLESDLEERELRTAVLEAVKALDQPDREILLRKFYLGERSKEIAGRLGLTVSNVDARTSRAVERLRKRLKEWRE